MDVGLPQCTAMIILGWVCPGAAAARLGCAGHSRSRDSLSSWSQPNIPAGCRRAAAPGSVPALTPAQPQPRHRHREGTKHQNPGHQNPGHQTQQQPMQVRGSCSTRVCSCHRDGDFCVMSLPYELCRWEQGVGKGQAGAASSSIALLTPFLPGK